MLIFACRVPYTAAIIPLAFLLPNLLPTRESEYFALPGCNYGIITNPSSDEVYSKEFQITMRSSAVKSIVRSNSCEIEEPIPICLPVNAAPAQKSKLKSAPVAFVVDTDSSEFLLDTGANRVIVNDKTLLTHFALNRQSVKGIGGSPVISGGTGTLSLPLTSDQGHKETVVFENAIYCRTSPFNLLPPQILMRTLKQQYGHTKVTHDDTHYCLEWIDSTKTNRTTTLHISANDLFVLRTAPEYTSFFRDATAYLPSWKSFAGSTFIEDTDASDDESAPPPTRIIDRPDSSAPHSVDYEESDFAPIRNIPLQADFHRASEGDSPTVSEGATESPASIALQNKQHLLSTYHERFGHLSFATLKLMATAHLIPHHLATVPPPVCPGCAYGKAHRKPWRTKGQTNLRHIKKATRPGQVISTDQLVSPTPGFMPTHRGRPTKTRYIGATVFVDHYSDFTYVHLMSKMDAAATVEAKMAFERVAKDHGVRISHYHADNGLYDTKLFKESIRVADQTLSFCGVNAHHQNGIAERRIKDINEGSRTALLHAAHRWPKAIDASLWSCALKNYVNLRNALPKHYTPAKKQGRSVIRARFERSPLSAFSGTIVEPNLKHFHPFGSPVYVLKETLQSQHSHNKWSDRSRVGIFLCHSPSHASDVPLILNTQSGMVSPQFHAIYDDNFDTVKRDAKFVSLWQSKSKLQSASVHDTATDMLPTQTTESELPIPGLPRQVIPSLFQTPWSSPPATDQTADTNDDDSHPDSEPLPGGSSDAPPDPNSGSTLPNPASGSFAPSDAPPVVETTTRSGRISRPARRYDSRAFALQSFIDTFSPSKVLSSPDDLELLQDNSGLFDEEHPMAFVSQAIYSLAASHDPDTMTLDEALRQPDREEFIKAMHKELSDHIGRKHWKVVPIRSIPHGRTPIPMVWSMKRKRNPIGEIIKWKARLCAGGHRQIFGIDYWSTYSPVVSWNTVRLMVIMAKLMEWHIQSIDFVLAFPQAPVATDTYMKPPKVPSGFRIPDLPTVSDPFNKVYKLLRNLYGLKDAGRTWHQYLKTGLLKRHWVQSDIDTCLFTNGTAILILYVDDAAIISPDPREIATLIKSLQQDYDLTDEGELHDYLGTRFISRGKHEIEMVQPRMIQRVLESVGLDSNDDRTKMHDTPASSDSILQRDTHGKPRLQKWNYRAAVGCLSYLNAMVRPDITYAVQQCARFSNDPKQCHEEAVKRICRYLLRTKDRGLVLRPDKSKGLECYVDADWAGNWHKDFAHDPASANSRTGYVISFAGCPIVWGSKMQILTALSTTEAEYIALSSALREVISVMNLLNELRSRGFPIPISTPNVVCKVFEDNKSCIEIATNHKTRPRTKHLSVRLHHFRSFVQARLINIVHVSTHEQVADIFTKPLPRDQFRYLRDILMGWTDITSSREGV